MSQTARTGRPAPDLSLERSLLAEHDWLVAVDEVGRGALAGPVAVGATLLTSHLGLPPAGLRDSKLLTAAARVRLLPQIHAWTPVAAVGFASAEEIDLYGIMSALRLAGHRALQDLALPPGRGVVLLDGNVDWLSRPSEADPARPAVEGLREVPRVVTRVKADMTAASVAAASVLAKVARDQVMDVMARTHPQYRWERNKGYASAAHVVALEEFGPCQEHRRSWRLPGVP